VSNGGSLLVTEGAVLQGVGSAQIALGGTMSASGARLESLSVSVQSTGVMTWEGVTGVNLGITIAGAATLLDCDLTALSSAINVSATGSLTVERSRLAATSGNVLALTSGSEAVVVDNVFERSTLSTGISIVAPVDSVALDHNEFRVGAMPWFTQRAASYQALAAGRPTCAGCWRAGSCAARARTRTGRPAPRRSWARV
jgi:hypothetical protein